MPSKGCLDHRFRAPLAYPPPSGWAQLTGISAIFCFFLLTHEGSHSEVYQEFQPNYDIFRRWCQRLFRPQVPCTSSLHGPIANSTQRQQPIFLVFHTLSHEQLCIYHIYEHKYSIPCTFYLAISDACGSDLALGHVMQVGLGHAVPERAVSYTHLTLPTTPYV